MIYKEKASQSNTDADTCRKAAKSIVMGICSVKRERMTSFLLKQLKSLAISLWNKGGFSVLFSVQFSLHKIKEWCVKATLNSL